MNSNDLDKVEKVFNLKAAGISGVVVGLASAATLYNQGFEGFHLVGLAVAGGAALGAVVGFIFKKARG